MATIVLRFTAALSRTEVVPNGPLFHRWVPDDERDAIELTPETSPDPGARPTRLRVWFAPRGSEGGLLRYDPNGSPFPANVVARYAKAEGGPVHAELTIDGVSESSVAALAAHQRDSPEYEALGARVYKAIHNPIASFIALLKTVYGQCWLVPPEHYDADKIPLLHYFRAMEARWRLETEAAWHPFTPGMRGPRIFVEILSPREYREYLTERDWRALGELSSVTRRAPFAAEVLSRAALLLMQDDIRAAAVEGYAGLEVALESFVHARSKDPIVLAIRKVFDHERNLEVKFAMIAPLAKVAPEDYSAAVPAIHARHKIVHGGWVPLGKARENLRREVFALLRATAPLIPDPGLRVLKVSPFSAHMPPEEWEEAYRVLDDSEGE